MSEAKHWIRSSYSDDEGGACVEVAFTARIHIRDSKNPEGPRLTVPAPAWSAFIAELRPGA
ncbi:hypothetical protein GCM10009535_41860 [Streptomyces thermocarboxydovorans]|uniref:DUF397 domain-containing protein n=1 Tax=Streptomyces thermocarboxydovorans TaxID=59298 RepID=A0ABN1HLQ8_9ACTN